MLLNRRLSTFRKGPACTTLIHLETYQATSTLMSSLHQQTINSDMPTVKLASKQLKCALKYRPVMCSQPHINLTFNIASQIQMGCMELKVGITK